MVDGPGVRIGDSERDQAVTLLREHLAAGRIDAGEFDERMSAALQARYASELEPLFGDLPGVKPGQPRLPEPVYATVQRVPLGVALAPLAVVAPLIIVLVILGGWHVLMFAPLLMLLFLGGGPRLRPQRVRIHRDDRGHNRTR